MNHRTWICTVLCLFLSGCGNSSGGETDASVDAAGNMDAGKGKDSGADGDTDTDSDTDIDTDTDMDTDTDTDSDSDADSGLPRGCELLSPANENGEGWTGKYAMDDDHLVWRWLEDGTTTTNYVLMVKELSTGNETELLRGTSDSRITTPSIYGNNVVFSRQVDQSDYLTREIFIINLNETQEQKLTTNGTVDADPISGDKFVAYYSGDSNIGLRYSTIANGNEEPVTDEFEPYSWSFDGNKWIVYMHDGLLYKLNLDNPTPGPQFVDLEGAGFSFPSFNHDTHEMVAGAYDKNETDGTDIWVWDIEAGTSPEVIVSDPYDQVLPDYDDHVIAYLDSQANGTGWRAGGDRAEVRIVDRDTKVIRKVMPLDVYYGIGIWSHYLAMNNYGRWGDSIILCDLLEGGFMDADGHVIPEGGAPDAGVPDSGVPDAGSGDCGLKRVSGTSEMGGTAGANAR